MKYFGLIWSGLWRKKIRTTLTILSVLIAFLLFALLNSIGQAIQGGGASADAPRLVIIDKISLINPLPVSYESRIAAIPGVESITHQSWFGGYYQDPRNQFPQFPVIPDSYLVVYPEIQISDEHLAAWKANQTGAVIGEDLMELYGWKVGDRIPIYSPIYPMLDGSQTWEFDIVGTLTNSDPDQMSAFMLFRHKYFNEANAFGSNFVGWYTVMLAEGADAATVTNAIDLEFANSPNETETSTEQAFAASFANQFGNIILIVSLILGAVFFTILLVAGNTMSQSVRERIPELAVLKTVGFRDSAVLNIVLAESILVMLIGGALGLLIASVVLQGIGKALAAMVPGGLVLSGELIGQAVAIMIVTGIVAGIFPALQAMRLTIVEALARG